MQRAGASRCSGWMLLLSNLLKPRLPPERAVLMLKQGQVIPGCAGRASVDSVLWVTERGLCLPGL